MKTRRAEQDYRDRVARVVAAIVADPMAEHRLEDLARLANFSPFHFHRIYRGITGETVGATLRRVRLALATQLLNRGDQGVTQVGMAVGYDSPQAFARAFGQFAGQSPRGFQRQMRSVTFDRLLTSERGSLPAPAAVRFLEWTPRSVQALRHRGPFSTIAHTHRQLRAYAADRAVANWLGVSCGDPANADRFRYYAAAESPDDPPIDGPQIEELHLPGGLYAVHCLVGPHTRINAAVDALYARWLPDSGFEPDDRPTLERYLSTPREAAATRRTELLIPIRSANRSS